MYLKYKMECFEDQSILKTRPRLAGQQSLVLLPLATVVVVVRSDGMYMNEVFTTSGEHSFEVSWSGKATLTGEGEGRPGDKHSVKYFCFS